MQGRSRARAPDLSMVHAAAAFGRGARSRPIDQARRADHGPRHGTGAPAATDAGRRAPGRGDRDGGARTRHASAIMPAMRVIDSHTGGEPTRLVLDGGPELGTGPLSERVERFRESFDAYRSAIVNEPRGSEPLVGALLVKPHRADCDFGVIFFNNVGYLGMCGHGTIGLIASLEYAGDLAPGAIKIDTPVGAVEASLSSDGQISVSNVVSSRSARELAVNVPGIGQVIGDVAWGGNWFFLISQHDQVIDLQ